MTIMEPSNAHVYGVKHVLSSTSRTKFRNQNGLSRLLTFSHEHPLMLGRKLGDLFSEHFRDVKGNDKDTSKPEAHRFHLANHSSQKMAFLSHYGGHYLPCK